MKLEVEMLDDEFMEYENEFKSIIDEQSNAFIKLRRSVAKKISSVTIFEAEKIFPDILEDLQVRAVSGDIVAQDYLGYIYKKGIKYLLPVNIELAMKWQILAASNGNYFSITKLALFLNYAYDLIVFEDDFPQLRDKHYLSLENYEMTLGKLICDAIVDYLSLDALSLTKEKVVEIKDNDSSLRKFDRAKAKAVEKVLEYLRK